jgi:hypothetical protein
LRLKVRARAAPRQQAFAKTGPWKRDFLSTPVRGVRACEDWIAFEGAPRPKEPVRIGNEFRLADFSQQ